MDVERMTQKLNSLHNKLLYASENLSPFYPKEIYIQIGECQHALHLEITDVALTQDEERFRSEWFRHGEENLRQFIAAYDKVSALLRDRISRLAIVRST